MKEWFKMLFHCHIYEVYKEQQIIDRNGDAVGQVIVLKCKICGKLINHYYYFSSTYLR